MYKKGIFIFRRDVRLVDNNALHEAVRFCEQVLPIFIFTPTQVTEKNTYKSDAALTYMIGCLQELDATLHQTYKSRLFCFYGDETTVLEQLVKKYEADVIFCNQDYTPYAQKRDAKIAALCKKNTLLFQQEEDALLFPVEHIKNNNNEPYTIFTFFKNKALKEIDQIAKPRQLPAQAHFARTCPDKNYFLITQVQNYIAYEPADQQLLQGGRTEAKKLLHATHLKTLKKYETDRNDPSKSTSHLSAVVKFLPVSIREVFWQIKEVLGADHPLITQLIWRDFFYTLAYHFPEVFTESFNPIYKKIDKGWQTDSGGARFKKWASGTTGFPFVDAGMRQLNATGWMHNRLRMVTANFLCKDLLLDWRKGERYFAQKLIDYDPCVNNGNWQWSAGVGADPEKYGKPRIFNPWLQSKKFDPKAAYIKKWIPELQHVPAAHIHAWDKKHILYGDIHYPAPMVDHAQQRDAVLKIFASYKNK